METTTCIDEMVRQAYESCASGHCAHSFYKGEARKHFEVIETKGESAREEIIDCMHGGGSYQPDGTVAEYCRWRPVKVAA